MAMTAPEPQEQYSQSVQQEAEAILQLAKASLQAQDDFMQQMGLQSQDLAALLQNIHLPASVKQTLADWEVGINHELASAIAQKKRAIKRSRQRLMTDTAANKPIITPKRRTSFI